jgi:hypothetical protein
MDDDYREENKYKIQKGSKKRGRNTYHVSPKYLEKVYKDPFAARKAADDEDRQNLKEIRSVQDKIKPVKAVLGVLALGAVGAMGAKKLMKKSNTVSPDDVKYTLKDKNMLTDLYQKATKQETSKMNSGGEVEVMRGGDYIKDLID